jgi:hypothetical protein
MGIETTAKGLSIGLAAAAGFILTTMGVNGLYNNMSLKLFAIDAGYHLVGLASAGLIIGTW